ncbi:Metallo-dependent phosphatase-like protein [Cyathus striatus]|nr:Metallo-dependent phosphatase-like protein [Cyathus striatus]
MYKSLQTLLKQVSYNPESDVLIHVGDFLAKGPHAGSMAALNFMASNNITGVRGNHDQKIIEWGSWISWIRSSPEGQKWLDAINKKASELHEHGKNVKKWVNKEIKKAKWNPSKDSKWWARVPKGWDIFSDHYYIARDMTPAQFDYLANLPLKLYVPHVHTHIIHAGLLPSDPRRKFYDASQPLARVPGSGRIMRGKIDNNTVKKLREVQDLAVSLHVKQNTEPWVNLNMRSVDGSTVTRDSKEGKPWSKLWKRDNSHCVGYNNELVPADAKPKHALPCYPSSVIYGHAASRGLDIKRWSFGMDSGCVYGRKLTAMIIGPSAHFTETTVQDANEYYDEEDIFDIEDEDESESEKNMMARSLVPFGDDGKARIVKVKCNV